MKNKKIAVIGGGISGLVSAHFLSESNSVTLFEANDYIGGHTNTEMVDIKGVKYPVNTGFIVYNDWTYPNFIRLMERLDVRTEASDMSFSVHCENTGLEYAGTNLSTLFAQRKNLFSRKFWRLIRDIVKFNRDAKNALDNNKLLDSTLGEFLERNNYSRYFKDKYLIPMGAAIWSAPEDVMLDFPLRFFLRFFNNHGLLNIENRPQWRVLTGGSAQYIEPICKPFKDNIKLNSPVTRVERTHSECVVHIQGRPPERFDYVVFACHSDQALDMIEFPTDDERAILGAIPYQNNEVVLHTDQRMMPKNKRSWASWNYHLPARKTERATVTYHMNRLQNLEAPVEFLVTLNRTSDIDESKIIRKFNYAHPVFSSDSDWAQDRLGVINGQNRSFFCGAYWRNGFHEDGVVSALNTLKLMGVDTW